MRDTGLSSTGTEAIVAEVLVLLMSEWVTASAEPATRAAPHKARQTSQMLNSVDIFLISVVFIVYCLLYVFEGRDRDGNLSRALYFVRMNKWPRMVWHGLESKRYGKQ